MTTPTDPQVLTPEERPYFHLATKYGNANERTLAEIISRLAARLRVAEELLRSVEHVYGGMPLNAHEALCHVSCLACKRDRALGDKEAGA